MTEEQKKQFHKEQDERVEKLKQIKPNVDIDTVVSQEEIERIKEEKKQKARQLYYNYHPKPTNHPDHWRKIWE